jgi:hypothetical protein
VVDVWHCNALGVYSDVSDPSFNTSGQKFLRGYQVTVNDGVARFTTIYPGWYQGRAVHIHFKVRSSASSGSAYEFTSQLFFDDALTDRVHAQQPYASKGQRDLRNSQDGIYNQGGSQLLLTVTPRARVTPRPSTSRSRTPDLAAPVTFSGHQSFPGTGARGWVRPPDGPALM